MKNIYYELYHVYGEDTDETDEVEKFIGIFSSVSKAKEAVNHLIKQPGFKNYPKKSFVISKSKLNQYWWKEGFCSWREAMEYQQEIDNES